jgi:glycosyltransferase 2 family protein
LTDPKAGGVSRKWGLFILKAFLSAGLIWWLARQFDVTAITNSLQSMESGSAAAAFGVLLIFGVVSAERWRRICRSLRMGLTVGAAQRLFFISMFFNQTLSTTIGGDAARIWLLRAQGVATFKGVISIVQERVAGLLGLGALVAAAVVWSPAVNVWGAPILIVVGIMVALILGAAAWMPDRPSWMRKLGRACRIMRRLLFSLEGLQLLGLSIVIHGIGGAAIYLLAYALGAPLSLWVCLLVVPPTLLLATLPISIGGWGVREAALVAVLGPLGVPAPDAFMVSVAFGVMVMAAGLPGGLLWLCHHGRRVNSIPPGRRR